MKAVDLFAGAGGFSTGAVAAGLDVVVCLERMRTKQLMGTAWTWHLRVNSTEHQQVNGDSHEQH